MRAGRRRVGLLIGSVLLQACVVGGWTRGPTAALYHLSHGGARYGGGPLGVCRLDRRIAGVAMAARKRAPSGGESDGAAIGVDASWQLDFRFGDDDKTDGQMAESGDSLSGDGSEDGSSAVVDVEEDAFNPAPSDGWVEPSGETDADKEVATSESYLPLLLERKYGPEWAALLESAEADENEFDISSLSREDAEDAAGYSEDELRRMIKQQQAHTAHTPLTYQGSHPKAHTPQTCPLVFPLITRAPIIPSINRHCPFSQVAGDGRRRRSRLR